MGDNLLLGGLECGVREASLAGCVRGAAEEGDRGREAEREEGAEEEEERRRRRRRRRKKKKRKGRLSF